MSTTASRRTRSDSHSPQDNASPPIGKRVQQEINRLAASDALSDDVMHHLQDANYCKKTFGIGYPLFKLFDPTADAAFQRMINGYSRYWASPVTVKGNPYLVCNDWYERNSIAFERWLSSFDHRSFGE